jgi:hypothetical protein
VQTYVAFSAAQNLSRSPDADAPVQPATAGAAFAHAAAEGSVVALCGAPVQTVTEQAWPPAGDAPCPRCVDALGGLVGSLPEGPGPS